MFEGRAQRSMGFRVKRKINAGIISAGIISKQSKVMAKSLLIGLGQRENAKVQFLCGIGAGCMFRRTGLESQFNYLQWAL